MADAPVVFVLNGPNLDLLGQREPEVYGRETLADLDALCREAGARLGLAVECRQTNHEGQLVEWIHEARDRAAGVVINAAAYSHTSVAILDALRAYAGPVFEVHLSNVFAREPFRHHSYVSAAATGVMAGFGTQGYALCLARLARLLTE